MKSIGPYVISAIPPGAVVNGHAADRPTTDSTGTDRSASTGNTPSVDSAPLHGLDRLTGMPVLLHRLPEFVVPLALPSSPYLLPVFEIDAWNGQTYAVTELPLAAIPATHPDSAALGALRGLAALHGVGLIHGGLNAGQLWQIGRDVRLAGAGLPWQPQFGAGAEAQARDMAALGQTLDALGVRPAALVSLESMTAAQALEALETALAAPPAAPQRRQRSATPAAPPTPSVPPASRVAASAPPPESSVPPAAAASGPAESATRDSALESGSRSAESGPPGELPVAPPRYRSDTDVIVLSEVDPVPAEPPTVSPPAASTPATITPALPTPAATPSGAASPGPALSPAAGGRSPIRIGFDELPALLPDWGPADARPQQAGLEPEGVPAGSVAASSEAADSVLSSPEPDASEVQSQEALGQGRPPHGQGGRPPPGRPGAPRTVLPGATSSGGVTPANRSQPLRIGWEEDHSWRVVKSGPERRRISAPRLSSRGPILALLALVLLGAGAWSWYSGQTGVPVADCCTQRFTVSGSSQAVKVTLVQAPPGSPLQPGALIGTAPGTLKFQGVPGRYVLKFSAAGHRAVDGAVRVPSEQPFGIVLK